MSDGTRAALLAAAERLFADRGIEGPSLREITRAAGQRNTNALQYHFRDRYGLLRAVLERHGQHVERHRTALLDGYEAARPRTDRSDAGAHLDRDTHPADAGGDAEPAACSGRGDAGPAACTGAALRDLAAAMVLPAVAKLDDPDGGSAYLQVVGEIVARPLHFAVPLEVLTRTASMGRWSGLVGPLLPPEAVGRPLHRRFAAIRFAHGELASRARERGDRADHRLFTSHLVDLVTAVLAAPVSDHTRRLIRRRR